MRRDMPERFEANYQIGVLSYYTCLSCAVANYHKDRPGCDDCIFDGYFNGQKNYQRIGSDAVLDRGIMVVFKEREAKA